MEVLLITLYVRYTTTQAVNCFQEDEKQPQRRRKHLTKSTNNFLNKFFKPISLENGHTFFFCFNKGNVFVLLWSRQLK